MKIRLLTAGITLYCGLAVSSCSRQDADSPPHHYRANYHSNEVMYLDDSRGFKCNINISTGNPNNLENIAGLGFWDTMGSRDDFVSVGNPRFKSMVERYGSNCLKMREAVERERTPLHIR